jgi:hypothetical protein
LFTGHALALGFFSGPAVNVVFVVATYLAQVAAGEWIARARRPPSYRVNSQLSVFITELPIFGQLNLSHPRRVDLGRLGSRLMFFDEMLNDALDLFSQSECFETDFILLHFFVAGRKVNAF